MITSLFNLLINSAEVGRTTSGKRYSDAAIRSPCERLMGNALKLLQVLTICDNDFGMNVETLIPPI